MYADYEFYAYVYGGTSISAAEYEHFALKAEKYINDVTFGRITTADDSVKRCACEIAECYKKVAADGGVKQGESIGGYSYSLSTKTEKSALYEIACSWLPADLLYRGVR